MPDIVTITFRPKTDEAKLLLEPMTMAMKRMLEQYAANQGKPAQVDCVAKDGACTLNMELDQMSTVFGLGDGPASQEDLAKAMAVMQNHIAALEDTFIVDYGVKSIDGSKLQA
ncbi:MAG: hypothetical protein JRN62_03040 [Nitrososphaerota archaeon]|jgi:hypothetical protein|nr:hypothetical protein [Nitrososphaerota archaeon]MDG6948969.1 hypothetical protein [Nitrososphaerota archaeon]